MQFIKKTSSNRGYLSIAIKLGIFFILMLGIIFFLNQIDFPKPDKEIEKIIPNENFKIVK